METLLKIPSKAFNEDWDLLQQFLERRGNPRYVVVNVTDSIPVLAAKLKLLKLLNMSKKEKLEVCEAVDRNGFEYTFVHGYAFDHIKDSNFQALVKEYVAMHEALSQYIQYEEFLKNY